MWENMGKIRFGILRGLKVKFYRQLKKSAKPMSSLRTYMLMQKALGNSTFICRKIEMSSFVDLRDWWECHHRNILVCLHLSFNYCPKPVNSWRWLVISFILMASTFHWKHPVLINALTNKLMATQPAVQRELQLDAFPNNDTGNRLF